jgi:hypothetical protein
MDPHTALHWPGPGSAERRTQRQATLPDSDRSGHPVDSWATASPESPVAEPEVSDP